MRAGGCTVQQALTAEAAAVVKQAVNLARRRGHAQVTPLHVANTMLVASTGLLRTACLQSHSHPLQCKALELCFNVALNRLPASTSSPMLAPHSHRPSISNSLVAAFKRAQAHQRRGSIENQQQPLLAVKIELEQLIISILDDPSVSRVMREAGFSSTQVKSNVEQAVSLEICSQTPTLTSNNSVSNLLVLSQSPPSGQTGLEVRHEDVQSVIEDLSNKRRSTVIVGECVASIEGVVGEMMKRVDRGDVPECLRSAKFISISLFSCSRLSREEVEEKIGELICHVKESDGKGVILYLSDLKWVVEFRTSNSSDKERNYTCYCPVEHLIVEIGRLVCGINAAKLSSRLWLVGTATFQTYMRCRNGHPSLETLWGLHPVTIPAGSLNLSLIPDSGVQSRYESKKAGDGSSRLLVETEDGKRPSCCGGCSARFESEARSLHSSTCNSEATTSSLPPWLQQCRDESERLEDKDQDSDSIRYLCKKWNSFCSSVQKQQHSWEKTLSLSSASPSSSTSGFSYDHQNPNLHPICNFLVSDIVKKTSQPTLKMYVQDNYDPTQVFSSNPSSTPNSAASSDVMEMEEYVHRFNELNAENLKILCIALEKKVPWQKDVIPEIASTVLRCRSKMVKRKGKGKNHAEPKEETWLFFQGIDIKGKEKIARELARLIFGAHINYISIALSNFSSTRADSTEDFSNKRLRDERSSSYIERFAEAVAANPHRVFFVEDVEQADYCSQMGLKKAIERGRIANLNGEEVNLSDAIIILSCESFNSRSRACSPPIKQKTERYQEEAPMGGISFDLNISFADENAEVDQSIDDIGLLDSVDQRIIFKIQEL